MKDKVEIRLYTSGDASVGLGGSETIVLEDPGILSDKEWLKDYVQQFAETVFNFYDNGAVGWTVIYKGKAIISGNYGYQTTYVGNKRQSRLTHRSWGGALDPSEEDYQ